MKKPVLYSYLATASALLAACGQTNVAPAPSVQPTSVSGTLSGWTGGTGSVEMLAYYGFNSSATNPVLANGTLNADGSFNVGLPSAATVAPYLVPARNVLVTSDPTSCTGQFTSSNDSAQTFASYSLDVRRDGTYVTTAVAISFTDQSSGTSLQNTNVYRFWVYADRATTLSGSQDCTSIPTGLTTISHATMNASLAAGWNLMRETSVISSVSGSRLATVDVKLYSTNDASGPWVTASLGKQSLKSTAAPMYDFRLR